MVLFIPQGIRTGKLGVDMEFQWYPGHMTKAKRQMQEDIKLIDLVIELVDARIPLSSRNPDIDELGKQKARLILLNKADLADPKVTAGWKTYFQDKGYFVVTLDARNRKGMKEVTQVVMDQEPTGACYGRRYSKCRKVDLYQFLCWKSLRQDRQ